MSVPKNPFHPGVGTLPPFLAGRGSQLERFEKMLDGYPEKRTNLRVTGLRGVGKTVLLKRFEREAKKREWVVIRRDLSPRTNDETEMALFMSEILREAAEEFSTATRAKNLLAEALAAIREIELDLGEDVKVTLGGRRPATTPLESRIFKALSRVGHLAEKQDRGFALMLDEAHTVADREREREWPLYALISAFVRAQDQEDPPAPVMLILCGLPPLISHLQAARSHAERFFKAESISNLSLDPEHEDALTEAAQALVTPTEGSTPRFDPSTAEQIAADVDGYPYFIQYFGEALWDSAEAAGEDIIGRSHYAGMKSSIQRTLDDGFFDTRYRDVRPADQQTLRVAASLGGESFTVADLNAKLARRKANANAQSLNRLVTDNVIFRNQYGVYDFTAPLFGSFVRRRYPILEDDT